MRELLVSLLIAAMLVPQLAFAEPVKVGDQPKNLRIIPPWTMRLCPTVLHATYDQQGAIELKKRDNDCAFWRDADPLLRKQIEAYKKITDNYKSVVGDLKTMQQKDQQRMDELMKQLKTEIAEKNQYKYKTSYSWLWGLVGGGVALVATGVAVGLGVAYANK